MENDYDLILGHNNNSSYYVKFMNRPYSSCKWVTEKKLLESEKGIELLKMYKSSPMLQKTSPPYYDSEFDKPDQIIKEENGKFLVKWKHLSYSNLTWEDEVDQNILEKYQTRNNSIFPEINSDTLSNLPDIAITDFQLYGKNLPNDVLEQVQFYFEKLQHGDVYIDEGFGRKSIIAITAFLHCLMQYTDDPGPSLIVVEKQNFNEWYDYLNESDIITTIPFIGLDEDRKFITENYFFQEDQNKLKFQVLITIPSTFESDIEILQQIQWKFTFFHTKNVSAPINKNNAKGRISNEQKPNFADESYNHINAIRKIFYLKLNQEDLIDKAQIMSNFLNSASVKNQINQSIIKDFQKALKKIKVISSPISFSPYYFIIDCPLNNIQKSICRCILYDFVSKSNPPEIDFFALAKSFYYIIQHPYTTPFYESKIRNNDIMQVSTKTCVLNYIINSVNNEFIEQQETNIVIATNTPEIQKILLEFVEEYFPDQENIFIVYMNPNNKNIDQPTNQKMENKNTFSFETAYNIICYDGKLTYWRRIFQNNISEFTRVFKLEALSCRENEILEKPTPNDEKICQTIILELMLISENISPEKLFFNKVEFEMVQSEPCKNAFAEELFSDKEFWPKMHNYIDRFPTNENWLMHRMHLMTEKVLITKHQMRLFLESFASFGWGKWDLIIRYSGIPFSEKVCQAYCQTIVLFCMRIDKSNNLNESIGVLSSNFVVLKFSDYLVDSVKNKFTINLSEYMTQTIIKKFPNLLERIFRLSCLEHIVKDINSMNFSTLPPFEKYPWWTSSFDQTLAKVISKYGYSNHVWYFLEDDKMLQSLLRTNVDRFDSEKRKDELLDYAVSYVMNDCSLKSNRLRNPFKVDSIDLYDQQQLLSMVLNFGFDLERIVNLILTMKESGNCNYFSKISNEEQAKEAVSSFLEFLSCEVRDPHHHTTISFFTALRLFMHDSAMKVLHSILNDDKFEFQNYPIWQISGFPFSKQLEILFFKEIKKEGFCHIPEILSKYQFSGITNKNIIQELNDKYKLSLRIMEYNIPSTPKPNPPKRKESSTKKSKKKGRKKRSRNKRNAISVDSIPLPLELSKSYLIHDFGSIVFDRPGFYSERYIFPAGFKSSRKAPSITDPNEDVTWFSEIEDTGKETPLFRSWEEGSSKVFEGNSPTIVWNKILMNFRQASKVSVSGPEAFGLNFPVVRYIIQNLPNARRCKSYTMINLDEDPQVIKFLDEYQKQKTHNDQS